MRAGAAAVASWAITGLPNTGLRRFPERIACFGLIGMRVERLDQMCHSCGGNEGYAALPSREPRHSCSVGQASMISALPGIHNLSPRCRDARGIPFACAQSVESETWTWT